MNRPSLEVELTTHRATYEMTYTANQPGRRQHQARTRRVGEGGGLTTYICLEAGRSFPQNWCAARGRSGVDVSLTAFLKSDERGNLRR